MAKKRFKLWAVLKQRQRVEDNVKKELADLQRALHKEREILNSCFHEESQTWQEVSRKELAGIQAHEITLYRTYLQYLDEAIRNEKQVITGLEGEVNQKLSELLEARKRKKVLENLKNVQEKKFWWEVKKEEVKINDEITTVAYIRDKL